MTERILKETTSYVYYEIALGEIIRVPKGRVAISKIFADAQKNMTLAEWKLLVCALCGGDWKKRAAISVEIYKKMLAKIIGIKIDPDNLSCNLKSRIKNFPEHSLLNLRDSDDNWRNGQFIEAVKMRKNKVVLVFNNEFLGEFGELERNFIDLWSQDIFDMRLVRSVILYVYLRRHSDTRATNETTLSTKEIKELFGIPYKGPGSYVRASGAFDRFGFEKSVIDPVIDDLRNCQMIELLPNEGKNYYTKIKINDWVEGYRFQWKINTNFSEFSVLKKKTNFDDCDMPFDNFTGE